MVILPNGRAGRGCSAAPKAVGLRGHCKRRIPGGGSCVLARGQRKREVRRHPRHGRRIGDHQGTCPSTRTSEICWRYSPRTTLTILSSAATPWGFTRGLDHQTSQQPSARSSRCRGADRSRRGRALTRTAVAPTPARRSKSPVGATTIPASGHRPTRLAHQTRAEDDFAGGVGGTKIAQSSMMCHLFAVLGVLRLRSRGPWTISSALRAASR